MLSLEEEHKHVNKDGRKVEVGVGNSLTALVYLHSSGLFKVRHHLNVLPIKFSFNKL